jgi:hypothetical protein
VLHRINEHRDAEARHRWRLAASPRIFARDRSMRARSHHHHSIVSRHKGGDVMTAQLGAQEKPFCLEEATIEELHAAITSGQTTCVAIVQHYIDRARV